MPGNHDTHKISGLTKEEYAKIVHEYNKTQKKAATSYYFYPSADIIAIVLDNVSSGMPSTHGMYNDKTLKFLDETLSKNKNKKSNNIPACSICRTIRKPVTQHFGKRWV